ncbi:hypothetical protein Leryth_019982 [Lithospermum erythrorhizon]|nr:hypothetical protein Leryth_019982 [Lithospermum erythrorhizon]
MEGKNIPHVVVLPYPSQGHINPLLQLAKRLVSKGAKATLATTRYTVESINVANVSVEAISDGFDAGGFTDARGEDVYLKAFKDSGSRTLSNVIEKYHKTSFPVTCVIYDSFLPWALDVARQYGIYGGAFFTNSATVCSIFCYLHHGKLSLPVNPSNDKPLVLPGLPPLNAKDLPSFIKKPESNPAYLRMKLSQYTNLDDTDFILCNTFQELEGEVEKAISNMWPAKFIGPMVPSAYLDDRIEGDKGYGASLWKPSSEECINWLQGKQQKSVVYISFGSMVSLTSKQMEEMAWALEASRLSFLWVVRESALGKLPERFIDSTRGQGLVVSWCNQLEMLDHPAIGCFVTHCGWNSTLEGLSLGVPMIAIPQWADQLTDAKFIEEIWGIGSRPKEDEFGIVRADELLLCLKDVMVEGRRSEGIRRNAKKWKQLAKEAVSEGGSSDKNIDEFVQYLKSVSRNGEHKEILCN